MSLIYCVFSEPDTLRLPTEIIHHGRRVTTPALASPKVVKAAEHRFRLVEGLSTNVYVYAALWDVRDVRIGSIVEQHHNFTGSLFCVLYYSVGKNAPGVYVEATVKELHTYKSLYTSAAVKCPTTAGEDVDEVPLFVGLVESEYDTPTQTFAVENMSEGSGVKTEFTVCIPAMFELTNAAKLVEKIEMDRLLGAGRVVLYNLTISSNVDTVLRMYAREWKEGRETLEVVVMPWFLPTENGEPLKIPYFAQQLAINDCMFRYKRLSKYMVFNDLDEFLVPLQHDNWSGLIADQRRIETRKKKIGWRFSSSIVNEDRPSPAAGYEEAYLRYGSSIFGLTSRDMYIFPSHARSKLIVEPTGIEEMGVHHIWEGDGYMENLPVEVAMLFHYRWPVKRCNHQVKETRLVEKYGQRLLVRFNLIWSKLDDVELGFSPFKTANHSGCKHG